MSQGIANAVAAILEALSGAGSHATDALNQVIALLSGL